ncbi:MAG: TlpA family protein disulfide reductase [Chitinophagaceae bacterium]
MKFRQLVLLGSFCFLSVAALGQREAVQAQQELVGSKLWRLEFTDWIRNQPEDSSFRGKYKVLEFWASWCRPCLEAVPHLNELQRRFSDSAIVFLSVAYEAPESLKKAMEKVNFETIVVSDQTQQLHLQLRIGYRGTLFLPRTVILGPDNKILWYGTPRALTEKLIETFLKRKS